MSSFALYASMINDQSQSHVCIRAEVHAFLAQSPGLGQSVWVCVCVEVTETEIDKNMLKGVLHSHNKRQKQSNSIMVKLQICVCGVVGDMRGQWACGSCPALDLRMLAHPVLLPAR